MTNKAVPLCLLAFVLALVPLATAQTITGTVTDSSGAIVPNVSVTAANTGTNLTYPTQTNEAGVYNLLFLPVSATTPTWTPSLWSTRKS